MPYDRFKYYLDLIADKLKNIPWDDKSEFEKNVQQLVFEAAYVKNTFDGIRAYARNHPQTKIDMPTMLALINDQNEEFFWCPKHVKGKPEAYSEQGMEGYIVWSVYDKDFPGYKGLFPIEEGDHIKIILNKDNSVVYNGIINFTNKLPSTGTPIPDPKIMPYEKWSYMFDFEPRCYTIELTKSTANIKKAKALHNKRQKWINSNANRDFFKNKENK